MGRVSTSCVEAAEAAEAVEAIEPRRVGVLAQEIGENWAMYNGDCCEVIRGIPDASIGMSVFSPPFASLYVYSASDRDMGNSSNYDEFCEHFQFLISELLRVLKPGRLCCVHCMNLPTSKTRDGYIGLRDFRGDIIRSFVGSGFIYHSEVCIWKNPATEVQRTKAIGLLHKQMVKDSCMSRMAIPDYVCTFRAPGVNDEPVSGKLTEFIGDVSEFNGSIHAKAESLGYSPSLSVEVWQRYASPVWDNIRSSRTLQYMRARDEKDEAHIAPLQLDVIERCLELWSNPQDTVLSPFGGIGSEGYSSLLMGRRYLGIELKPSYYQQAVKNLRAAEEEAAAKRLF